MILGAVLMGGRSSRFGSNKAMAEWNGRTLADHAAALVGQFVDEVVTVGGAGAVPDLPAPGLGPLGGIAGALGHAAGHGFTSVVTIACDMPRVPSELLTALLRRAPAFCSDAPVLGHWPNGSNGQLLEWLRGNDRSIRGWVRMTGALPIASPVPLGNINTVADLAALDLCDDLLVS